MKSKIFALMLVLILGYGLIFSGVSLARDEVIIWGSASLGSDGYQIIEVLVANANNHIDDFTNTSISTAGGSENVQLMEQGVITLGQATSSDLYNAYHGVGPFNEPMEFTQMFAYGAYPIPICVLVDSDINKLEELEGKSLGVGPAGGAAVPMMEALLEEYGLLDEVELVFGSWNEIASALRLERIDAAAVNHLAGRMLQSAFEETAMVTPFRPIEVDTEKMRAVTENNEGIQINTVFAEPFDSYEEDTEALGITTMLMASPELTESQAYEITKVIFENQEEVREYGPRLSLIQNDFALEGLVKNYPVHPGAARYFKEIGIWDEEMVIYGQ